MFRRWIAAAGLAWMGASAGCGDRYGEPIVGAAVGGAGATAGAGTGAGAGAEPAPSPPGGGQGSAGEPAAGGEGGSSGAGPLTSESAPLGLCAPCTDSDACGDANDVCIRRDSELFCGRDCDEGLGCPDGYQCAELDNIRLFQCVPVSRCSDAAPQPTLDELRQYLLERINAERLARDRPPLAPSACLDSLAQESALDYARTDEPLGKFIRECEPLYPNCSCGWSAQAEATVVDWALDWTRAVDGALGNDRIVTATLELDHEGVGIGFWLSGDEAWLALSFR